MPRPCAVETHARRYIKTIQKGFRMPRPCAVETHARRYKRQSDRVFRCHGLAPWRLTLAATKDNSEGFSDATALCRGVSRSPLQKTVRRVFRCHGLVPWSLTVSVEARVLTAKALS